MNLVYYENTSKDEDFTYEKEISNGINIKYNFKINDNLNSQIKFGYKSIISSVKNSFPSIAFPPR